MIICFLLSLRIFHCLMQMYFQRQQVEGKKLFMYSRGTMVRKLMAWYFCKHAQ